MPLIKGYSQRSISKNIEELIKSGKSPDVAKAIAYDVARQAKKKAKRPLGRLKKRRR